MSVVVIGSGPAGVAAAHALAAAGRPVTVLDAGDQIEAGGMDLFDALAGSDPVGWPPELLRRARGSFPVGLKHVPLKPAYGSLFPYALEDPDLPVTREHVETLPSLAYGGLSNSWGASMLPFRQRDIEDWPISVEDLRPHYEAVLRFVPVAAERDALAEILPLYTDTPGALRRGPQAEMLLGHLDRHARGLRATGIRFGASRLAVVASSDHERRCRYSGMCLYGCPYRSIYNASHTLERLVSSGRVEYRGGVYVDRLSEVDGSVSIDFHQRGDAAQRGRLTSPRVFVACGSISSTRLVLESLGGAPRSRRLRDSQYFVIPMLTARAASVSVARQGITLAQVFMELEDPAISERSTHLQLYGYNDLMLAALAQQLPLGERALERLLGPVLGRSVVVQGYLHSADSPGLTLELDATGVRLRGEPGAGSQAVRAIVRRLARSARLLGMVPLPGLAQIGSPGKGNHIGGSFPMSRRPDDLQSDTLGRLPRWRRIHLVDASVFPSLPATTVTLSVMANAHRVATSVAAGFEG